MDDFKLYKYISDIYDLVQFELCEGERIVQFRSHDAGESFSDHLNM